MSTRLASCLSLLVTLTVACEPAANGEPKSANPSGTTDPLAEDYDGDGVVGADDCDDGNASVYPGAEEVCDGVDNDCDGVVDPETATGARSWSLDADGDGFGDPSSTVRACDQPDGAVDNALDCDDGDALIHPEALEICDDLDNDCDTLIDDEDDDLDTSTASGFYADVDGDGYGDENARVLACAVPSGFVEDATDCNDASAAAHPDAQEICDDLDNDCDELIDDADDSVDLSTTRVFYADTDGDGYGVVDTTTEGCSQPSGYATEAGDCDDDNGSVNPGATEVCDEDDVDEDCNALADDNDPGADTSTGTVYYPDGDGDGFGDRSDPGTAFCDPPVASGWVLDATDCDDVEADIHPDATEICDASDTDEDCNGVSDDADPGVDPATQTSWYADTDGDGFGAGAAALACEDPSDASTTYSTVDTDCDDDNLAIHPDATEVCDDIDNDCDELVDDDDPSLDTTTAADVYYPDADGDGFGDDTATAEPFCEDPGAGYSTDGTDCDDSDDAVNPDATEVCNFVDDDCDASTSSDGMAWWEPESGTGSDYTATLGAGSSSAPAALTLSDNGTLFVCAGTWYVTADIDGPTLAVVGVDSSTDVLLDGGGTERIFDVSGNAAVNLVGLTLQNGATSTDGAGVRVSGAKLTGSDVVFSSNEAGEDGAGIYASNSTVELENCSFDANDGRRGGGLYATGNSTTITVDVSAFSDNTASEDGGGIAIEGDADLAVVNSTFDSNMADEYGGAIRCNGGDFVTVSGSDFSLNDATFDGGAMELYAGCTGEVSFSTFTTNSASDGGAFWSSSNLTISDSDFTTNSASDDGGGLFLDYGDNDDCELDTVTFDGNDATDYGGAIFADLDKNSSDLNGTSVTFTSNTAGSGGNAIRYKDGGTTKSYGWSGTHNFTCSGGGDECSN